MMPRRQTRFMSTSFGAPKSDRELDSDRIARGCAIVATKGSLGHDQLHRIYSALRALVSNAQEEVLIENAYFVPRDQGSSSSPRCTPGG
jgi:hypothetical protein